uniref:Uncharacterized protein n=1 Tax=Malurus cyaneus samueli TaxID=2593467 RepID=A0A8C5X5M5_9PASS
MSETNGIRSRFVQDKAECEQELHQRMQELTWGAEEVALQALIQHVEQVKAENRNLRQELLGLLQHCQVLRDAKVRLQDQQEQLLRENQCAQQASLLRSARGPRCRRDNQPRVLPHIPSHPLSSLHGVQSSLPHGKVSCPIPFHVQIQFGWHWEQPAPLEHILAPIPCSKAVWRALRAACPTGMCPAPPHSMSKSSLDGVWSSLPHWNVSCPIPFHVQIQFRWHSEQPGPWEGVLPPIPCPNPVWMVFTAACPTGTCPVPSHSVSKASLDGAHSSLAHWNMSCPISHVQSSWMGPRSMAHGKVSCPISHPIPSHSLSKSSLDE